MGAISSKRLWVAITLGLLVLAAAVATGADAKKHRRLRLTCDQTTQEIFNVAERYRADYNAKGWTIEPAPDGLLVGGACKNIAPLTRQGRFYMADVHHHDTDPPFPGETDPRVTEYHWIGDVTVRRTKKGKLSDTVQNITCVKDYIDDTPPYDIHEVPC
jgi:hypothetical protein